MRALVLTLLAAASLGAHCDPFERCLRGATRCVGNVAEICSASGSFHELVDCDRVSSHSSVPFVCAFVDATTDDGRITGHTCVPASTYAVAGAGR